MRFTFYTLSVVFEALVFFSPPNCYARQWYVSTNGLNTNSGTFSQPWALDTALRMPSSRVAPGDTINIRGGVYKGIFVSKLAGTPAKPILVRNFPGEVPVLDAYQGIINTVVTLTIDGPNTWFYGLEITNSSPSRISIAPNAGAINDIHQATGINVFGAGVRIINCEVHDLPGIGIGYWSSSVGAEVYGCLVYNNGVTANDRGHGPNFYVQNAEASQPKSIRNSFIFSGFSTGVQFYASTNKLQGFILDSNTIFNSGSLAAIQQQRRRNILAGGETGSRTDSTPDAPRIDAFWLSHNILYRDTTDNFNPQHRQYAELRENSEFGFQDEKLTDKFISATDNHFYGDPLPIVMHQWDSGVFRRNFVYSYRSSNLGNRSLINLANTSLPFSNWDSNTYHINQPGFNTPLNGKSFDQWRTDYRIDANSRFFNAHPQENFVFVRPNKYDSGKLYITVMNYQARDTVKVAAGLSGFEGWRYALFDVQQSTRRPIAQGTYTGDAIGLPMFASQAAATLGQVPVVPKHTSHTLGTFILAFYPQAVTIKAGEWNDPSVWLGNSVPQENHDVLLQHPISIKGMAFCKSLQTNGQQVTVSANAALFITGRQ